MYVQSITSAQAEGFNCENYQYLRNVYNEVFDYVDEWVRNISIAEDRLYEPASEEIRISISTFCHILENDS